MSPAGERSALVLGASGLVGSRCLERLLEAPAWGRVCAPGRRPLAREHPELETPVIDFDRLDQEAERFAVDDVFCCLGTTMKRAGSRDAFRKVDHQFPFEAARLAAAAGADQFLIVTALGADPRSRAFYSRVKGEVEAAVKRLSFGGLHIFRPALLVGPRAESRPLETFSLGFAKAFGLVLLGPLRRYRPIAAEAVARAMVAVAAERARGINVYPSERIQAIAERA